MYKLILYDTSNFEDFPIGGQLTSIRNFLYYMAEKQTIECKKVLLVGITNNKEDIGKIKQINLFGVKFDFLPVLWRDKDLSKVEKSLRVQFVQGLFFNGKNILCDSNTLHYIHTPEAYIYIKFMHPFAKTAVFSHGSFFNMTKGFRFFPNNILIKTTFEFFLKLLLKTATCIFVLDMKTKLDYEKYGANVKLVDNSIILPLRQYRREKVHKPLRVLFVGRLSKVKCVDNILKAIQLYEKDIRFTIVGDGEERNFLLNLVKELELEGKVIFTGSVTPNNVRNYILKNDILIMNSILEGKPMTIIEAISYGMPVITTPVGGIGEMLKEGNSAFFTTGSVESIVEALDVVTNNFYDFSCGAIEDSRKFDYKVVDEKIYNEILKVVG